MVELVFEGVLWWKRTGKTGPLWISLLKEREVEAGVLVGSKVCPGSFFSRNDLRMICD